MAMEANMNSENQFSPLALKLVREFSKRDIKKLHALMDSPLFPHRPRQRELLDALLKEPASKEELCKWVYGDRPFNAATEKKLKEDMGQLVYRMKDYLALVHLQRKDQKHLRDQLAMEELRDKIQSKQDKIQPAIIDYYLSFYRSVSKDLTKKEDFGQLHQVKSRHVRFTNDFNGEIEKDPHGMETTRNLLLQYFFKMLYELECLIRNDQRFGRDQEGDYGSPMSQEQMALLEQLYVQAEPEMSNLVKMWRQLFRILLKSEETVNVPHSELVRTWDLFSSLMNSNVSKQELMTLHALYANLIAVNLSNDPEKNRSLLFNVLELGISKGIHRNDQDKIPPGSLRNLLLLAIYLGKNQEAMKILRSFQHIVDLPENLRQSIIRFFHAAMNFSKNRFKEAAEIIKDLSFPEEHISGLGSFKLDLLMLKFQISYELETQALAPGYDLETDLKNIKDFLESEHELSNSFIAQAKERLHFFNILTFESWNNRTFDRKRELLEEVRVSKQNPVAKKWLSEKVRDK